MYRTLKDGRIVGVLNDFDVSCIIDPTETLPEFSEYSHFHGTKAFVSSDLLPPEDGLCVPPHRYRHDLESLLWVMRFHTERYAEGRLHYDYFPPADWIHPCPSTMYEIRLKFLNSEEMAPTYAYQAFGPLLQAISTAFLDGYNMQDKYREDLSIADEAEDESEVQELPKFDLVTLGGHVSFDIFEKLFVEHRPSEST